MAWGAPSQLAKNAMTGLAAGPELEPHPESESESESESETETPTESEPEPEPESEYRDPSLRSTPSGMRYPRLTYSLDFLDARKWARGVVPGEET